MVHDALLVARLLRAGTEPLAHYSQDEAVISHLTD